MPTWIDNRTLCRLSSALAGAFSSRLAVDAIPNSTVTSRARTTCQYRDTLNRRMTTIEVPALSASSSIQGGSL